MPTIKIALNSRILKYLHYLKRSDLIRADIIILIIIMIEYL